MVEEGLGTRLVLRLEGLFTGETGLDFVKAGWRPLDVVVLEVVKWINADVEDGCSSPDLAEVGVLTDKLPESLVDGVLMGEACLFNDFTSGWKNKNWVSWDEVVSANQREEYTIATVVLDGVNTTEIVDTFYQGSEILRHSLFRRGLKLLKTLSRRVENF